MSAGWYEEYCENCGYTERPVLLRGIPHNVVYPKCQHCGHQSVEFQKTKIPLGTIPVWEEEPA